MHIWLQAKALLPQEEVEQGADAAVSAVLVDAVRWGSPLQVGQVLSSVELALTPSQLL